MRKIEAEGPGWKEGESQEKRKSYLRERKGRVQGGANQEEKGK